MRKTYLEFNQKERAEALLMLDIADAVLLLKDEELSEVVGYKPENSSSW